jgi:multidrug resistance efflux pump
VSSRLKSVLVVLVIVVAVALGMWLVGQGEAGPAHRIEVAGNVRTNTYTVLAPPISLPTPDFTVGLPSDPSEPAGSRRQSPSPSAASGRAAATRAAMMPSLAGVITSMTVSAGDIVAKGDVIAQLDTTLLEIGVRQAQTAAAKAHADVDVLSANLGDIDEGRDNLASARSKLVNAQSKLASTRKEIESKRAELADARKKAVAGQKQIEQQIEQLEAMLDRGGDSVPGTPTPAPSLTPGGPRPEQMLAALKAKLAEVKAGIRQIDAGIAQIDDAFDQLDAGKSKIEQGWNQLATGARALDDAERKVRDARDVLGAVADAADVGVALAKVKLSAATIVAPLDGVVTSARTAGTVAMVGAPIARIEASGERQLVDTYLTAEQLRHIEVGSAVRVKTDSLSGEASGRIVFLGTGFVYPPTSFPTSIVHMTRAVKVTAALDPDDQVPAGTPVDLTITTIR